MAWAYGFISVRESLSLHFFGQLYWPLDWWASGSPKACQGYPDLARLSNRFMFAGEEVVSRFRSISEKFLIFSRSRHAGVTTIDLRPAAGRYNGRATGTGQWW
jgi:hypothetical protein